MRNRNDIHEEITEAVETDKKSKKKRKQTPLQKAISGILILAMLISGGYIAYHQWQSHLAKAKFQDLQKMKQSDLKKKYPSMVAWVKVLKTKINYPVMRCPKNNSQYWLRRNIDGDYSIAGSLFMDPNGDIAKSYNLLIYGHSMQDNTMFGGLRKFKKKSYAKKHNTIKVTKWYDDGTHTSGNYKIFAVYMNSIYDRENHLDYPNIQTKEKFNKYIKYCNKVKLFSTKVKPEFGDELVSLSTCSYHVVGKHGRLVVVGVKDNTK